MATLSDKDLDEILEYLQKSILNLAKESFESMETEGGFEGIESFLKTQFDIRLENLLAGKNSGIHHLESGRKNKVILQKQKVFDTIRKEYCS